MPDSRIKEFTDWYHQEFQKKVGFIYNWKGGKEQKLMVACLKYFEKLDSTNPLEAMKRAATRFLSSDESYLRTNVYDLALFLSKPEKYIEFEDKRPKPEPVKNPTHECKFYKLEEFKEKVMEQINKDPVLFMRGFAKSSKLLKQMSEEKYKFVKEYLLDILGKERAIKIYEETTILKTL